MEQYLAESRRADTEFRIAEAKIKRRWRFARLAILVLLIGIIVGLIGWINQATIADEWRWYTFERPFVATNFWPYVLKAPVEQSLKPMDTFRECATEKGNDYCPQMMVIPAGSFTMGSPPDERDRYNDEGPRHAVTIKQFAASKFDVTFDEWAACVKYGPCVKADDHKFGYGLRPAINVSWDDAHIYVAWLSSLTGKPYHLLSESEWEYAARAGSESAYSWGPNVGKNHANCIDCGSKWDGQGTAPVGSFPANTFGLYDMEGNVWQWVEDCYHRTYDGAPSDGTPWLDSGDCSRRVVRGGSWYNLSKDLRVANRVEYLSGSRFYTLGFRVGRTLGH
jgi:formylglycine-generating enzyme required for sulfatase activity